MFWPLAENYNQQKKIECWILIVFNGKIGEDNLTTGALLSEPQNSYQNQIWATIIYQEKMPKQKLDYFARKTSEYIFAFWPPQINNYRI
jgi:hypothetical protein